MTKENVAELMESAALTLGEYAESYSLSVETAESLSERLTVAAAAVREALTALAQSADAMASTENGLSLAGARTEADFALRNCGWGG